MATKRKKTAKKKAKKRTTKKKASVKVSGGIPKVTFNMPLDAKKVKAIERCIKKGNLKISLSKVDLAAGRLGDPWIYD